MTLKTTKLRDAIGVALIGTAVSAAGTGAAFAQSTSGTDATTLDRVEVTGSRIKRADVEGPSPITVIAREDIDVSGELSVADFLRNNVYNSTGSTRESSGSATGSYATISLRGLGAAYTLVLLDGRRMTSSPALYGGAADINMIPMAAVERIEILREGAAAVYGSDAIGGVVNVILRRDFEGLAISAGYANPTRNGRPNEESASIVGGLSSDRGNVVFTLDHQNRDMMLNLPLRGEIIPDNFWYSSAGLSQFNSSANFFSPSTGLVGVDNCETYENNTRVEGEPFCRFEHGATSANESSLKRDSLMVKGNYSITDNTEAFFRSISSNTDSLGIYASAPVDTYPTIAADNPFNPFGVDGTLYYRFTPLGTRDAIRKGQYRDVMVGLRGMNDWFGGLDWEVAFTHGRSSLNSIGLNYGIGSIMQDLIDAGQYNPFDPTHPSVAVAAPLINHTITAQLEQRVRAFDGNVSFDLFDIGDRSVGFVTGFEYREERLGFTLDAQSVAGNVFGSAGSNSGGSREYGAVYFESLLPILSNFSVTLAGRYDDYSDVGGKFSPRVSLEFRPIDSLLFRGAIGKGFRAPTLDDLYGASGTSNLNIPAVAGGVHPGGDELACAALTEVRTAIGDATYQPYPVNPCQVSSQYQVLLGSNPNLEPEESKNWGAGVVFSPTPNFSVALDYYDIEISNIIATLPRALNVRFGDQGLPGFSVTRGPSITAPNGATLPGPIQSYTAQVTNGDQQRVRGVDLEVGYTFQTGGFGDFTTRFSASHQLDYDYTPAGLSTIEYAGSFGSPRDRASLFLGWSLGDVSLGAIANYIGASENKLADGSDHPSQQYPSWTTVDLQAAIAVPWNAKVSLGVRNVADKSPPVTNALGFPFYDNSLYNVWGRVPYIRYEQNF